MRTLRAARFLLLAAPLATVAAASCTGEFGRVGANAHIVVTRTAGDPGSPSTPLALSFSKSSTFTMRVEAIAPDGTRDTTFNGFVRASIKPGTVISVTGPSSSGRNVQLTNGLAEGVAVEVIAAYGNARIWFEDIGYVPADPIRVPPPQCSDGLDNNNNGVIDFPADPGCAFANDDTESSGTFATGTSDPLYFSPPRIADVRGISIGGNGTVFPHDQVQLDTGWRGGASYAFDSVVTRVAADGFYVTDLQDDAPIGQRPGFGSVFAFTYSTPPFMRVCDRVQSFGGTASDFFGFTEIGFPTWNLDPWDALTQGDCKVPEPAYLAVQPHTCLTDMDCPGAVSGTCNIIAPAVQGTCSTPLYTDNSQLFTLESSLVRIASEGTVSIHIPSKFGSGFPKKDPTTGLYVMQPEATNCDFDRNGKISFDGGPENQCANACDGDPKATPPILPDPECSEYSAFASQSNFMLTVTDTSVGLPGTKVGANGSSDALFDPTTLKGKPIKSFTGTLRYFSGGGGSFTIEARCDDDIIVDPNAMPIPSTKACVHARTVSETNDSSH